MLVVRWFRVDEAADVEALRRRLGLERLSVALGTRLAVVTGLGARAPFPVVAEGGGAALVAPEALPHALVPCASTAPFALGSDPVAFGGLPRILGIINVTPDSFSDGGQHAVTEAAVAHGLAMVAAGADWLDIGGESTRPGAVSVPTDVELERVLPVIRGLHAARPEVPLSIDTTKPDVAAQALAAGAVLVNDVSGFGADGMAEVVAKAGASACVMHRRGTPASMQQAPRYDDVVHEVVEALEASLLRGEAAGVPRERVLVDPGIGFGKTLAHNLALLRHLEALRGLRAGGVLLGTSRKSFLGAVTGVPEAAKRVLASAVTAALAASKRTVDVVRVHDVSETREALRVADAIRTARQAGDRW
jgi:dihydropteroate synthase